MIKRHSMASKNNSPLVLKWLAFKSKVFNLIPGEMDKKNHYWGMIHKLYRDNYEVYNRRLKKGIDKTVQVRSSKYETRHLMLQKNYAL